MLFTASTSFASGLMDHGEDLYAREKFEVALNGYLRTRGELLHNLDLDRGTTPSGRGLYATPLGDPNGQLLAVADLRVRTDLAVYAPFAAVAVKLRADLIDDLVMGSTPSLSPGTGTSPTPATSPGQLPTTLFRLKRAYAEALTPLGLLSAGRMGAHWGLGLLANGGDCLDCDRGDAADRIAFVTPVLGHFVAAAYDFTAVGPLSTRQDQIRGLVLEPSANVHSISFALMNPRTPVATERRRRAGRTTVEYGVLASHRWQDQDVPQSYLNVQGTALTSSQVVPRGFRATVFDVWARVTAPMLRVELEGALAFATVAQPSLIPGVLLRDPGTSLQWGGAAEIEVGSPTTRFSGGLYGGVASGDPAPGFGAYPAAGVKPVRGELDAPQADFPRDTRVDNFRFNPDYRVDRILFAEIVGTVTDALYVRPWAQARLVDLGPSSLKLRLSGTYTRALFASSTPGGDENLGLELHGSLRWESRDGFDALLEYAVLFPFAGLSNPAQGLQAQPAQLLRLRLAWVF
ncbi:MAG: TIGR04551 family protein [Myxococcaceae bacterium]|nr:TIGR04551 family protein [Myxococcaceae bacterium]